LADSKVKTWNLLNTNQTTFGGGEYCEAFCCLENPSIIKLSELLRKDIKIGKDYFLTCEWYLTDDYIESLQDDWRAPQIGYYFGDTSVNINIPNMRNFFLFLLDPNSTEKTINFSFMSNSKKYNSISIYSNFTPTPDGFVQILEVFYDNQLVLSCEDD
jgi:hypothetical protein